MRTTTAMLSAIVVAMGSSPFARAQDEGGSCAYWYDQCQSRGGSDDYCRAKLRTCKADHCWVEVNGHKHCQLSIEYNPDKFGGKKVFFPHGCPQNLDKECIKTRDGRLIGCRCVS
jgi:hypothetical protein